MKRLFYDLEIRAQRVEADINYINKKPIDDKHDIGFKIILDSTLSTHGEKAKSVVVDQIFKALDEYYSEKNYSLVSLSSPLLYITTRREGLIVMSRISVYTPYQYNKPIAYYTNRKNRMYYVYIPI